MKRFCLLIAGLALSISAAADMKGAFGLHAGVFNHQVKSAGHFSHTYNGGVDAYFYVMPSMALETGYQIGSKSKNKGSDAAGRWEMSMQSQDWTAGIKLQSKHLGNVVAFFGRAGYLHYRSQFEIKESYYGYKPAGKDKTKANGHGWYSGVGISIRATDAIWFELETSYKKREKYFESTSKSFHATQLGTSARVLIVFP